GGRRRGYRRLDRRRAIQRHRRMIASRRHRRRRQYETSWRRRAGWSGTSPVACGSRWHRPGPATTDRERELLRWRLGTEEAIAVVAEAGQDVFLGVQLPVPRRREDLDVRVRCLQRL